MKKKKLLVIFVIITSMIPMIITAFGMTKLMIIACSLFEGNKVLIVIKVILFILNWLFSLLWLWFAIVTVKLFKQDKRIYFLYLLIPIAFWHNIFITFFLIYYSIVPFAP